MRTTSSSDSSCGVGVGAGFCAAGVCCVAAAGCVACVAGVACGVWPGAGASSESRRSGVTNEGGLFMFGSVEVCVCVAASGVPGA